MRACAVRCWAPLGLLLCLHFPGLFARSICAVDDGAPQHWGHGLPLLRPAAVLGASASAHPRPGPGPGPGGSAGVSPPPVASPADPQLAGGSKVQRGPSPRGLPSTDLGPPGEPWQTLVAAADHAGDVQPEGPALPPSAAAPSPGGRPPPTGASASSADPSPRASLPPLEPQPTGSPPPNRPGAQGEGPAQRAPRAPSNGIHRPLLPGHPWGPPSPTVSWGGGGHGAGGGTRPMPTPPVGSWGVPGRLPGGSWGSPGRLPGGSWGSPGRLPGGSWGSPGRFPGGSWGSPA
ncbi:uncharacterized protein C6orf15 homolog [Dasypus novemcinctus]|uniref:uncharacterized protein C6orf15 homolog n=1 Tax=Dasypus novemcinctus TaxID=9361 RepID=UPI00265E103E|nr:uncharacterized protein C6orf15 homolog [Dasypus novemcinctus]